MAQLMQIKLEKTIYWVVHTLQRKGILMLIRVRYVDDRFDMVRPELLDSLLDAGKVREFERGDGWVIPGINNVRHLNRSGYTGIERRTGMAEKAPRPGVGA